MYFLGDFICQIIFFIIHNITHRHREKLVYIQKHDKIRNSTLYPSRRLQITHSITPIKTIDTNAKINGINNFIRCLFIRITFHSQYVFIASTNSSESVFVSKDLKIFIQINLTIINKNKKKIICYTQAIIKIYFSISILVNYQNTLASHFEYNF